MQRYFKFLILLSVIFLLTSCNSFFKTKEKEKMVTVSGYVTDKNGKPEVGADVVMKNYNLEDIYSTKTDKNGYFNFKVKSGLYFAFYAVKDYGVRNLEYWGWNVTAYDDLAFNVKIDGLELYAINHFRIQKKPHYPLYIYVRIMSLHKTKEMKDSGVDVRTLDKFDWGPELNNLKLKLVLNGKPVNTSHVQIVGEMYPNLAKINGFLITIMDTENIKNKGYNRIDIEAYDTKTKELGQGSHFWKEPNYINEN